MLIEFSTLLRYVFMIGYLTVKYETIDWKNLFALKWLPKECLGTGKKEKEKKGGERTDTFLIEV